MEKVERQKEFRKFERERGNSKEKLRKKLSKKLEKRNSN